MDYLLPLQQFCANVALHPNKTYLHQPVDGQWNSLTWSQVDEQARQIAAGLLDQGLERGDRVAILSKNCAEWFITDFAIMMAGLVSVPIYSTAGETTIRHVLSHSGAKAIFLGKLDKTDAANAAVDSSLTSIAFPYPTANTAERWQNWLDKYEPLQEIADPQPDEIFTLVYTSGSTGLPKGVQLSQRNVASSSYTFTQLDTNPGVEDRILSYLPLAHITERCVVEIPSLYRPLDIYFNESLDTFVDDMRYAQPTLFVSVPRLWAKFQSQILAKMPDEKLQRLLKIPIVRGMVQRKIRKGMGLGHARLYGSGSAPISPSTLQWYERLGMEISEGWGMTETSGLSCGNNPFVSSHLGTIGVPVDCVEMKLSDEGEILIRGDAIFSQYYNNPDATAAAFIDDWFRTGDRAEVRPDGAWRIIGRVKEQFKTAKGKYVAPVPIESLFGEDSDIEQICVLGSGRKQPVAVVVLNEEIKVDRDVIRQHLQTTLDHVNTQLESHQRLDHVIVADSAWTIENDLLTPTLKMKRDNIENRYKQYLDTSIKAPVVWESELGKS